MQPEAAKNPRLRPYLAAAPDHLDPRYYYVWDRLGLTNGRHRFTQQEFNWMKLLNGERSLVEIQNTVSQVDGFIPGDALGRLIAVLEEVLFLDGPRFRAKVAEPVRKPSCVGAYEGDPDRLRQQLRRLFTHPAGAGLPNDPRPNGSLRAALLPHIDYGRGGITYTWGFKEVAEQADADLFVIIATSHYSPERFTLTRKHFQTPLGTVTTDQAYIDRLVHHYGDGLFDDELAHLPEHSVELEIVFLQYLFEGRRPIRVVPLVVGSFHDCVHRGVAPKKAPDIERMIQSLRKVEEESGERICYIISGDLAHIGPKFGDADSVSDPVLQHSRKQDEAIMSAAEKADPAAYFDVIAQEQDVRRICGLPPTYTLLEAIRPSRGKMLHYDQYVHPQGFESVSFASMTFYR
jgi:AmmeMemoRadiSam system protein B